jgi:hypothetical protein
MIDSMLASERASERSNPLDTYRHDKENFKSKYFTSKMPRGKVSQSDEHPQQYA